MKENTWVMLGAVGIAGIFAFSQMGKEDETKLPQILTFGGGGGGTPLDFLKNLSIDFPSFEMPEINIETILPDVSGGISGLTSGFAESVSDIGETITTKGKDVVATIEKLAEAPQTFAQGILDVILAPFHAYKTVAHGFFEHGKMTGKLLQTIPETTANIGHNIIATIGQTITPTAPKTKHTRRYTYKGGTTGVSGYVSTYQPKIIGYDVSTATGGMSMSPEAYKEKYPFGSPRAIPIFK